MSLGQYKRWVKPGYKPLFEDGTDGAHNLQTNYHAGAREMPHTLQQYPTSQNPIGNSDGGDHGKSAGISALGKPARKKRIDGQDITVAVISLLAFALAVVSVASNSLSWRLGVVYQLVVSGFLLSVMNLCLTTVTPYLFVLLEARLGSSTLQNYNGILRGQMFSSRLSFTWRLALCTLLAIPLGLSAAYKVFVGGQSSMVVDRTALVDEPSIFGWVSLPGLHNTGFNTGITLFSNATQPYAAASAPRMNRNHTVVMSEPEVPKDSQAYGANLLVLSKTSAAMLDLPRSSYLLSLQNSLRVDETYTLTADVNGTVASLNEAFDTRGNSAVFQTYCANSGSYEAEKTLYNFFNINLYPNNGTDWNQSIGYIGFTRYGDNVPAIDCRDRGPYFQGYNIARYPCRAHWNVTKSTIQLVNGHCEGSVLPPSAQLYVTLNQLGLNNWYLALLIEFLGPFTDLRAQSPWRNVSTATAIAAMIWSRVADLDMGQADYLSPDDIGPYPPFTYSENGVLYTTPSRIISHKATLVKSGWLYFIFGVQPVLIIVVLGVTSLLHSVPVGKGFGLITILAGIETKTLHLLRGASLSGELNQKVRITMCPSEAGGDPPVIDYHISKFGASTDNGRLIPHSQYY